MGHDAGDGAVVVLDLVRLEVSNAGGAKGDQVGRVVGGADALCGSGGIVCCGGLEGGYKRIGPMGGLLLLVLHPLEMPET